MSDGNSRRSGRWGGVFVALVVVGSAVGVVGWYVVVNRAGPAIDASGFDLSATPQRRRPAPAAAAAPGQPASSLALMKGDAGIRIGDSAPPPAAPAKAVDKKDQAHDDFKAQARRHEADVRKFAEKMTRKYPLIRQYGKDWMGRPDLKKLNDDYMRDRDPIAFIAGLSKAPSLGGMVKKYAGAPAIMEFITEGMKEAPGELTSAAMDVLSNDAVVKRLIGNVAAGLGLPPSVTGLINSGGDPAKIDQSRILSDIANSPAAQQQGQPPPPPVVLDGQR